MKKKIITCILPFAMLLPFLSSCHGSEDRDVFEVPEAFDTSKKFELSFWSKNDSNKNQADVYAKAVEDFHAIYPNITVKVKPYTDYKDIYNDVITNIPTDTTPNVCISYPDNVATYMTGKNVVVPLTNLMEDGRYGFGGSEVAFDAPKKDEVVSRFLNEGVLNGEQYVIPFMRSTEALYINKDFVEKLGYTIPDMVTWDWIWEVSDKAMEKEADGKTFKVNGDTTMIPFIYKSTDNMMITQLKQRGFDYSTESGDILLFNDDTASLLDEIKPHAKLRSFSTFSISSYPANHLNAGHCIFAIDSTAGSTWMGSDAPLSDLHDTEVIRFETVVKEVPQYDVEHPKMISQGPSLCVFNKADPQEVLASWLFTQFLLTNDVQIGYSKTEGYIPVTNKAINSAEYKDYLSKKGIDNNEHYYAKIDSVELFNRNIENTFVTPVFNGSASLRTAAGQLIEETVKGERRNQSVKYEKLFADITKLYRLDQIEPGSTGLKPLGPLPTGAIVLFSVLGGTWVGIAIFFVLRQYKERKRIHTKQ